MATTSELTIEHYKRHDVREIISKFAMLGDGTWRALNGDFRRWYRYSENGDARLLNVEEDYDHLICQFRTLYQTLNVFDASLRTDSRPKKEITADNPLGTPANTAAYTLGVDIDKGHDCEIEDPEIREAVEAAVQFLVNYLKKHGVHESVWLLFSGGGAYVEIHHAICRPMSSAPEDRAGFFEEITDRYNRLIAHVAEEFFKTHPKFIGKVKYDALNNSKRVFKCILSIHKKKPYAVTPIDKNSIKIDLRRARVPLEDDMLAEAKTWYSTYDPAERESLLKLLDEFKETEEEKKQSKHHFKEIWRSSIKVDEKHFPPCIKHIIDSANPGEGKTRFTAVLSTFLYQMGWDEELAWELVEKISNRNGLENADHIFDSCFGRVSCPSCQKIQNDGSGYPHLGLKGLGACQPVAECDRWPGGYVIAGWLRDRQKEALKNFPKLDDLTKATGRMDRINPDTGEKEPDPITGETKVPKRTLSPSKASAAITVFIPLKISKADTKETPKLWRYDGGIWQPDGEKHVINLIDAIIGDLSYERGLKETLRRVRALSETVTFDSDPCLFPALDGVIDLRTGQARAFQPEDFITFRYEAAFNNPEADYRLFLWFLCSSLPDPRDVLTALDIVSAIAIRLTFDVIVLLFGGGSNGKGVLEKVILALFTMARATAVKLEEMKRSRFGPGALLNKDVWIVTEVESVKDAMSVLKAESTGEMIDADVKYGERVRGMPHAIPILDANNAFDFGDNSYGRKRRVVKLDFPYTFGDAKDMRPIDRHLEEKLARPRVLSGILQIIAARAPALVRSRRIYRRKSTEEQEDELKRQQFHLPTFFDDCISTTRPLTDKNPEGKDSKKLRVDEAYDEYIEYCKLFNTTPADRVPFGRYISERYKVQSVHTSTTIEGKKVDFRYYPGIYLIKSARTVCAEAKLSFYDRYETPTTDIRQIWDIGNDICGSNTTDTTDKVLSGIISEIEKMFTFISSCQNERDISYENYLKKSVVSVVSVVQGQKIAILGTTDKNDPVVKPKDPVVEERFNRIEADLLLAEEERKAREEHFKTPGKQERGSQSAEAEMICAACGADIGPGHGNYYGKFCSSCGPKIPIIKATAKAQLDGFILSDLWEELAARGRAPRREHLPKMLRYLGCVEEGENWRWVERDLLARNEAMAGDSA